MTNQFGGPTFSTMTSNGNGREDWDDFWGALRDHACDPIQVPILEALWRVGEPLSAIELVDVLDGYLTMWEAKDHLEVLYGLGVVVPASAKQSGKEGSDFRVPYSIKSRQP
jgi:hypothetical protein